MRKQVVAGNWKMHKTIAESLEFVDKLAQEVKGDEVEILIFPPFTALEAVGRKIRETPIKLGAQNIHWEDEGAFTGEISWKFIKETQCEYVLIGHSERRKYFYETNETINKKLKKALEKDITPVFCIGETLEEREKGKTESVLKKQLDEGLSGIDDIKDMLIAYEPVWAIGTGKRATIKDAREAHLFIREEIKKKYKNKSSAIRILYGGSVTPDNVEELIKEEEIDGSLIGGASLDINSFLKIIKITKSTKKGGNKCFISF